MSMLAEWMRRAAVELGLRVELEPTITLSDGRRLLATAHFPELGTPQGMYVIAWEQINVETQRHLHQDGKPISLIGEPTDRDSFDLDSYIEMFREWGWSAADRDQPGWMIDDE